jgi:hypothetical protein
MQKLMFAKIELWLVLLLAVLGVAGLIGYGAILLAAERFGSFGSAGQSAVALAEVPTTLRRLLREDKAIQIYAPERFAAKPTGWGLPSGPPDPPLNGYVLLSRYDGTIARHVIELVRLDGFEVVHRWVPDADALLDGVSRASAFADYNNWNAAHFREIHPFPMPNGDLIVKDHFSPLFRIDACARRVWVQDDRMFHHSTEADADGNLWIPALTEPYDIARVADDFFEDQITKVTPEGRVVFQRSVASMLMDHGMGMMLFSNETYRFDPTHLNDIQPVLADGPYWKKGDVFLSLRNLSMVVLYRPSTDAIVWSKVGPWTSQHDIDILDDHRIAIYDNDVEDRGAGTVFDGASDVMVMDFATGEVSRRLVSVMEAEQIRTVSGGLYTELPGKRAMIEDVQDARLLIVSEDGKIEAEYMNRAENGRIYQLGWSRYLDQAYGDKLLAAVTKVDCNE